MAQSNTPSHKPDLEESTNVAEAHGRVLDGAAAASREKLIRENGTEPVPVWVFLLCAVALLVGGSVLGSGGSFLGYGELVKTGYMTGEPPKSIGGVAEASGAALAVYTKVGKSVYAQCAGCHGATGAGQGDIPPLAGSEWVTGNTHLAATALIHGLNGPIQVAGQTYNGNMGSQAATMTPKDLAAVLTYIRNSFGNETGDIVTVEMAEAAFAAADERGGGQVTASELREKYDKMLPGAELDPTTIISFDDLQPIDGAAN